MKKLIFTSLAILALVPLAPGRTDPAFINNLVRIYPPGAPPVIDATNFINNSAFIDNTYDSLFFAPYATANTVNYTNFGVLGALEGFRFDTFNTQVARYFCAGNLHNEVGAIINCGGTNNGPYFATNASFFASAPEAQCLAWATNIINRGTIEMGLDSLLSFQGQNVSLSGGLVNMEGFESGYLAGFAGTFDGYWGVGQSGAFNPAAYFGPYAPLSPNHWITNRYYSDYQWSLYLPLANGYLNPAYTLGPSNYWIQVVYLQNWDPSVSNNVYFAGGSVVEWVWPSTNIITGIAQTNYLLLYDDMMSYTNLTLVTNGIAAPNAAYGWTYIPTNYYLYRSQFPFYGTPATPGLPFGLFPSTNIHTEYTAYEAIFQPTTVIVSELAGQTYSNMPGRIEITADKQLDLRSSRISGLNYLRLTATNHFTQDPNTRILTAVADYNLGVTNSTLVVSNLLAPTCPRLNGYVDLFSTRWTNVIEGITNTYHVLMVDSHLSSSSPSALQNLTLHATNVVISDVLNVLSNITIDADNLIITTNGPNAQTPAGQLNFPYGVALDPDSLPGLRTLTNYGIISVQNAAAFGSAAQPYWHFINYGSVLAGGCSIWSTNFLNTGLIDGGPGPINLSATSAVLSNGVLTAPFNDIVLRADSLFVSNQVLNAGHSLVIWATNSLNDGGPESASYWTAGVLGFNLPLLPPEASLLGTTITDTAPAWASVASQWAGQDRGAAPAGFHNNAALGRLILDGGLNSSFLLQAPAGTNALYVDYLELRNYQTNFDSSGNLSGLNLGPGMKIYYAQLMINGVSWAEKLNGKNGGGLNWVPDYAGAFSSTNMVYPNGSTNRLNLALVQSCNLDSDFDGIANCEDLTPVLVPSQVGLAVTLTNTPQRAALLTWNSIPYTTNALVFVPSVTATNWQVLTNFVVGPIGGPQRFVDPIGAGSRVYRVRLDTAGP